MTKLKIIVYTLTILCLLVGVFYVFSRFFPIDIFTSESSDEEREEPQVEGVNLNSLNSSSLNGEFVLYVNGTDDPQVIRYKLSSGRQRLLANLSDSLLEYYSPGKIVYIGDDIYWVRYKEKQDELVKINIEGSSPKESVLSIAAEGFRIVGTKVFDSKEVYYTQYAKAEDGLYDYSIIRVGKEDSPIFEEAGASTVNLVAGKDKDKKLILQNYVEETNSLGQNCLRAEETEKVIKCVEIDGLDYVFEVREPGEQGFTMGEIGFIDKVDNESATTRILEGSQDEHFSEMSKFGDKIFFTSGQVQYSHRFEETNYGSFEPVFLERMGIDGSDRTLLRSLPANTKSKIFDVTEDYILLGISVKGLNKYETKPINFWIYNIEEEEYTQLTDITCGTNSYCEVVYLGKL